MRRLRFPDPKRTVWLLLQEQVKPTVLPHFSHATTKLSQGWGAWPEQTEQLEYHRVYQDHNSRFSSYAREMNTISGRYLGAGGHCDGGGGVFIRGVTRFSGHFVDSACVFFRLRLKLQTPSSIASVPGVELGRGCELLGHLVGPN